MSLIEEDLPGVNKVRSDFQVREDESLAHRLQEQEFEEHYNSNVQLRRTARVDAGVASDLQKAEVERFRSEESVRRREIAAKEQQDREHAEQLAKQIQEEEQVQQSMKIQDEAIAKTLFEKEQRKIAEKRSQEEADARLARQSSLAETQAEKERRDKELLSEQAARRLEQEERQRLERKLRGERLSEAEARRLQYLQKQAIAMKKKELMEAEKRKISQQGQFGPANPQNHSVSGGGQASLPTGGLRPAPVAPGQPSASLPPGALSSAHTSRSSEAVDYGRSSSGDGFQLPSYDDLVGGPEDPPVMDENERIAMQEAEDEKLARQLAQTGVSNPERERREREDREYVQRLVEQEKKQGSKNSSPHHHADEELAKRLQQEEVEARKRQKQRSTSLNQQQTTLPGEDLASLELAKRLQKEEVMRVRQLKQQKLAQQRVIENEVERRKQAPGSPKRAAPTRPPGGMEPQPPPAAQPGQSRQQPAAQSPDRSPSEAPQLGQSGAVQQPVVSSYRPAMAGFQVPLSSQMGEGVPQARPSYKRDPKKKGKK